MAKDLSQTKGTIAKVLNDRSGEFFPYLESSSQFNTAHSKIMEVLNDPSLTNNSEVEHAKEVFERIYKQRKINLYVSTLTTYMTGMKVTL